MKCNTVFIPSLCYQDFKIFWGKQTLPPPPFALRLTPSARASIIDYLKIPILHTRKVGQSAVYIKKTTFSTVKQLMQRKTSNNLCLKTTLFNGFSPHRYIRESKHLGFDAVDSGFQLLLVGKCLLVESGIMGFGIQNTAKGFQNTNDD